jgi:hypothetical protein
LKTKERETHERQEKRGGDHLDDGRGCHLNFLSVLV